MEIMDMATNFCGGKQKIVQQAWKKVRYFRQITQKEKARYINKRAKNR
jgi:hypothetical protein